MSTWTKQAADAIEKGVSLVRDRTVEPAQRGVNVIIFGVLAGACLLMAFLLIAIGVFRVLTFVMPVWTAWITLGLAFIAGGTFCWTRRTGAARV